MPAALDDFKPDMVIYNAGMYVSTHVVTINKIIMHNNYTHYSILYIGTAILQDDPLGHLDITDVVCTYLASYNLLLLCSYLRMAS